jgi:hypothetical protein
MISCMFVRSASLRVLFEGSLAVVDLRLQKSVSFLTARDREVVLGMSGHAQRLIERGVDASQVCLRFVFICSSVLDCGVM